MADDAARRPRVAYLRGYFLGRSETDYMAHVAPEFDLTVFTSHYNRFNLSGAPVEIRRLPALEDVYQYLPGGLVRSLRFATGKMIGIDGVFLGLRRALAGFDLVNTAESLFYFSYQAARLKPQLKFRLVVLQHEVVPFQREHSPWVRHMRRIVHREADLFLARTERARDALMLEGVEPERIRVIPHGVDLEMFQPRKPDLEWRCRYGLGVHDRLIVCIARLTWEKGVLILIHALRLLHGRDAPAGRSAKLLLVGAGPERQRLRALIRRLELVEQVHLVSGVPFDEIPRLLSAADVFVLPSIASRTVSEQFGHVLLQAMACGRAVVASDCGPMIEVVGDAGLLVPQNDPHELANALARVLADDALRERLAARGLERVRTRFSAHAVAARIGDLYREALQLPQTPLPDRAPAARTSRLS